MLRKIKSKADTFHKTITWWDSAIIAHITLLAKHLILIDNTIIDKIYNKEQFAGLPGYFNQFFLGKWFSYTTYTWSSLLSVLNLIHDSFALIELSYDSWEYHKLNSFSADIQALAELETELTTNKSLTKHEKKIIKRKLAAGYTSLRITPLNLNKTLKITKWNTKLQEESKNQKTALKWLAFNLINDILALPIYNIGKLPWITDLLSGVIGIVYQACNIAELYSKEKEYYQQSVTGGSTQQVLKKAKIARKDLLTKTERRALKRTLALIRFCEQNTEFAGQIASATNAKEKAVLLQKFLEKKFAEAEYIATQEINPKLQKWERRLIDECHDQKLKRQSAWIRLITSYTPALLKCLVTTSLWLAGFILSAAAIVTLGFALGVACLVLTTFEFGFSCYLLVNEYIDTVIRGNGIKGRKLHQDSNFDTLSKKSKMLACFCWFFTEEYAKKVVKNISTFLLSIVLASLAMAGVSAPILIITFSVSVIVFGLGHLANDLYAKYRENNKKAREQQQKQLAAQSTTALAIPMTAALAVNNNNPNRAVIPTDVLAALNSTMVSI